MTEQRNPLDSALDLFVYIPVGIAMTAAEELPKLAAKGRAKVTGQLTVARMLGQFAVTQGRKEVEKRLGQTSGPTASPPAPPAPPPAPEPARRAAEGEIPVVGAAAADSVPSNGAAAAPEAPPAPADSVPTADGLAIPGYDSLSASQVVQRLAGLSRDELEAVGSYESTHRARRTVLTRVSELQSS